MQQIKIKSLSKKKSLAIQSIRAELFQKSSNLVSRGYNTLDQSEKDTVFLPSRRYLQSIAPRKSTHKQQQTNRKVSSQEVDKLNISRFALKQRDQDKHIKRKIACFKQLNQLKLRLKRSTNLSKIYIFQRMNKSLEAKNQILIKNYNQITKSCSYKGKRFKSENKSSLLDSRYINLSKADFIYPQKTQFFLKPLNVSVDLPRSILARKKGKSEKIKQLECVLLEENSESYQFPRFMDKKKETQISPWSTSSLSQTQQYFERF